MALLPRRPALLLFLGGLNLALIQFVWIRSLSSALMGTELVLFLAAFTYFAGFSAGYLVSERLTPRALAVCAAAQWATHLTLPFSLRWVVGTMNALDVGLPGLILLVVVGGFWVSSFYSVLLPRFLGESRDGEAMARLYAWELGGALTGFAGLLLAARLPAGAAMTAYQAILAAIVARLVASRALRTAAILAAAAYPFVYGPLERASVAYQLRLTRGRDVREVLLTADTAYQRVEIVEDQDGSRHLYLDGMRHYGSGSLEDFNEYIAGVPASLLESPEVVVIGSGSFEAVRHAAERAKAVTSVELDPVVAEAGRRFLSRPLPEAARRRWTVVFDDAKHYLAAREAPADLVSLDVAGPYSRQVAWLYTREFFELARSRLRRGGLVAVCLNADFELRDDLARRIVKTLGSVFEDVFVVTRLDSDSSFAYAGDATGLTKARVAGAGRRTYRVYDRADLSRLFADPSIEPIGAGRMDVVASSAWRRAKRRFR
ncbi:MAG: hypothetical protein HY553_21475 [Elusimicrobia bacterium]|nr:hypothetical protein [Elusimicrobiota bacterium]